MSARALGWDIHRKFSMVSVRERDDEGQLRVVERRRLPHDDRQAMRRWLRGLPARTPVALEAAFGWPWIADLLEEFELEPHLAHPPAVRVLAKHQAKSDRCDADRLAEFLLLGQLPESYLAPMHVRELRDRMRYRMALSRLRTGVKNRVQALLHRRGILHPFSDLFGAGGRAFLKELELSEAGQEVLGGYLELLDKLSELLSRVETWLMANLETDPLVQRLATLPGVALILAHVIAAEIGQIERFPSYRHLASYAGLAPLSQDSADRHGRRHISAACNRTLRWALLEAANVIIGRGGAQAPRLVALYQRLSGGGRFHRSQAKVAVARELAKLVYIVWTKQEPYTASPAARPGSTQNRSVRSDQPRHPMVRRRRPAVGQTLL